MVVFLGLGFICKPRENNSHEPVINNTENIQPSIDNIITRWKNSTDVAQSNNERILTIPDEKDPKYVITSLSEFGCKFYEIYKFDPSTGECRWYKNNPCLS